MSETKKKHRYWDLLVSAAFLRILGASQEEAGNAVHRTDRTIRKWEGLEVWKDARAEAEERWLGSVKDASRAAILRSVQGGNADLGLTLLERLDPRLAPPKQRSEVSGPDGGPIQVDVDDAREKVRRRLAGVKNRIAGHLMGGNGAGTSSGNGTGK